MITVFLTFMLSLGPGIITCVSVIQSETLKTFIPGNDITLHCKIEEFHENYFSWFRQSLGEAPTCILTLYADSSPVRHGDFRHDERFTAEKKGTRFTLTISNIREADSGIYYCAARDYDLVFFSKGVFLKYEGPNIKSFNYQINKIPSMDQTEDSPKLKEAIHPGDSVTLQCTVLTESCSGEHSVYWFRHGSGESHPGIIYTHGNRSDECKRSSETDSTTQSCVYKLPKRNLSLSDAGTYYCAVLMCGDILFGKGNRLEITDPNSETIQMYWKLIALAASNVLCVIIIVVLLCARTKKRNISTSGQPEQSHSTSAPFSSPVNENAEIEELSYAAINFPARKSKRRETQKETCTNVIYSSVSGLS
ncbi:uncharacterized protein LOC118825880 [Colossoma macropomum]|uniref:uncharacterized protein LOC118825880 n=1 Tax=Colossoma macropomum TaxID=42526 RepID=UPI0018645566|nr:uncharacterized protein LOC118825880 [Colossoma macropomum]